MRLHSSPREAENAFVGGPHVLVPKRVDDGVHQRVTLGQNQAVLLIHQDVTFYALQTIQKEDHQTRSPADHKST